MPNTKSFILRELWWTASTHDKIWLSKIPSLHTIPGRHITSWLWSSAQYTKAVNELSLTEWLRTGIYLCKPRIKLHQIWPAPTVLSFRTRAVDIWNPPELEFLRLIWNSPVPNPSGWVWVVGNITFEGWWWLIHHGRSEDHLKKMVGFNVRSPFSGNSSTHWNRSMG